MPGRADSARRQPVLQIRRQAWARQHFYLRVRAPSCPAWARSSAEASPAAAAVFSAADSAAGRDLSAVLCGQPGGIKPHHQYPALRLLCGPGGGQSPGGGRHPPRCGGGLLAGRGGGHDLRGRLYRCGRLFVCMLPRRVHGLRRSAHPFGHGGGAQARQRARSRTICQEFVKVYPVNYNCPGQLVAACCKAELESFCSRVKEFKGKAVPLAVSGGFHSPFMDSAEQKLAAAMGQYQPARAEAFRSMPT